MCGFAGFLCPKGLPRNAEQHTRRMIATLAHRGPDDEGIWLDHEAGIAFGHRRLSIVDLSSHGHQPMVSASGRYVLNYNGEVYNFQRLRKELRSLGHSFRGHSDTEVILAAFDQWDLTRALKRMVGMFAFALWDRKQRRLSLVRDRMGEKPLYYGWSGDCFLFGSELKALRAHPQFSDIIDRDALALYLRYNYVPSPYSIYNGIRKLPPATLLSIAVDRGKQTGDLDTYWDIQAVFEKGSQEPLSLEPSDAIDHLDSLLRRSVRQQMVADVPLGAFLSGGIDSSTIVALMQSQSTRAVRSFTIGFQEETFDEAPHAHAVASHLGTDHTELYVTAEQARNVIPQLASIFDEPIADSSQVPTYLVSALAKRDVTVSLSGDGGDELFFGYDRHVRALRHWQLLRRVPARRLLGAILSTTHLPAVAGVAGFFGANYVTEHRLRLLAALLRAGSLEVVFRNVCSTWLAPRDILARGVEPLVPLTDPARWPRLVDDGTLLTYLDAISYLPDDILVKVDRAAMAVSLETRIPLLDHRIVAFCAALPFHLKFRGGVTKWLLRQVLYRYVPRTLVDRPKMGFAMPVAAWLRGPLRSWAEELLNETRLAEEGNFRPRAIHRHFQEHVAGQDRSSLLWNVLVFQSWLEHSRSSPPS